jgi:hypothetical protein
MKTTLELPAAGKIEKSKRFVDALEVLIIGVMITILFLTGINTHYGTNQAAPSAPTQEESSIPPYPVAHMIF